jgi:hypothetical protein
MPSERLLFRRVTTKSVPHETRREAVRELGRLDAVAQLRNLSEANGLRGSLRRAAVAELKALGATEALETIAGDRAIDPPIREQSRS